MDTSDDNGVNVITPAFIPNSKIVKRFSPLWRQLFISSASFMCTISCGFIAGYSAILLPQLEASQEFNFSSDDTSWIASAAALSMTPACLVAGILMEMYGRKFVNLALNIPFVIGWMLIYSANGLMMFLAGRLILGIALGFCGPINSVYIGETADPKYRGILLGSISLGYTSGILFVHLLGTFLSWETTALICGLVNIYNIVIFIISPESPSYLLRKKQTDAAYEAFTWCRGYDEKAIEEFQSMIQNQKLKLDETKTNTLHDIRQPEFYKPLLILTLMFFVLQFVGVNVIAFYTIEVMKNTVGETLDNYVAMFIIDVVRVVITVLACILIKRMRRRVLCFLSGYGTGISMVALAIFKYFSNTSSSYISFLPLLFIIGYICFTSLGLMLLPWCLVGELFPLKSRGLGSGISSSLNFVFFFIVVKIAPFMFATIAMEGSFLCYGLVGLIGTSVLATCLPETKNKTLQEIEDEFTKKVEICAVKSEGDKNLS